MATLPGMYRYKRVPVERTGLGGGPWTVSGWQRTLNCTQLQSGFPTERKTSLRLSQEETSRMIIIFVIGGCVGGGGRGGRHDASLSTE